MEFYLKLYIFLYYVTISDILCTNYDTIFDFELRALEKEIVEKDEKRNRREDRRQKEIARIDNRKNKDLKERKNIVVLQKKRKAILV